MIVDLIVINEWWKTPGTDIKHTRFHKKRLLARFEVFDFFHDPEIL